MGSKGRGKSGRRPGARRRARELALSALYRADLLGLDEATAIASLPGMLAIGLEDWTLEDREAPGLREEAAAYAGQLIAGVYAEQAQLDEAIGELATDWRVARLAATDRAILRIAMWELAQGLVPPAVVVSEAVELAAEYGTAESPRFVNGILAARLAPQPGGDEA
jgi:N utilization substance protein B